MFQSIMHVAFFTDKMDEMINFYTEKLGGKIKTINRYSEYLNRDDRPRQQAIARTDPDRIFNVYIELAPLQFVEMFPAEEEQKPHCGFNEHKGYSHFALLTEDIFLTRKELEAKGVKAISSISKGPSETYQMWYEDPDGNRFEIMQFTENSLQIKGNV